MQKATKFNARKSFAKSMNVMPKNKLYIFLSINILERPYRHMTYRIIVIFIFNF